MVLPSFRVILKLRGLKWGTETKFYWSVGSVVCVAMDLVAIHFHFHVDM